MSPRINEQEERIGAIADAVLERIAARHGMDFHELVSLAVYVKEQKEKRDRLTAAGYFALIGSLIAAALAVAWEGFKSWTHR